MHVSRLVCKADTLFVCYQYDMYKITCTVLYIRKYEDDAAKGGQDWM